MNTHLFRAAGISLGLAIASVFGATAAIALEYGSSDLGGSMSLTWGVDWSGGPGDRGYLCVTRDTLEGTTRTAIIHRYAINFGYQSSFYPIAGVAIYPDENGNYVVESDEPVSAEDIWNAAGSGTARWFNETIPLDPMGAACVDTGIAGAIQYLERTHGIDIQE